MAVANLDIVVFPAGQLVGLSLRQPPSTGSVEEGSGNETASDQINGVVVAQIHGSPPNPASVHDEEIAELREGVAHKESFEDGISGVQRRECAKGQRGVCKIGGVEIDSEYGVDAREASGRAMHAVGRG